MIITNTCVSDSSPRCMYSQILSRSFLWNAIFTVSLLGIVLIQTQIQLVLYTQDSAFFSRVSALLFSQFYLTSIYYKIDRKFYLYTSRGLCHCLHNLTSCSHPLHKLYLILAYYIDWWPTLSYFHQLVRYILHKLWTAWN